MRNTNHILMTFLFIMGLTVILTTISCTRQLRFSKIIKDDQKDYNVFIQSRQNFGINKFYGATTPRQVSLLTKGLKLKIWNGYWEGMPEEGIIVTKNYLIYKRVYNNIIQKTNLNDFSDSLDTYTRNYRLCEKKSIVLLIDSLKINSVPFYLPKDTISFYGEQFFKIEYNIGVNKFPSKNEHKAISLTNDSIVNYFLRTFTSYGTRIVNYNNTRDGKIEINIAVTTNDKIEIKSLDKNIYFNIKSIKQVTVDNFSPITYYIDYFVKEKTTTR